MTVTLQGKVRGTPAGELFAGDTARKRYVQTYQLSSDAPSTDTDKDVLDAVTAQVGNLASAYGNDSDASLKNIRVRQSELVASIWYAELEYDSEIDASQGGGGGGGVDPVDLSPEIEYDYETIEVEAEWDAYFKPITTSAGEPFGETIVLQRPVTVLTYSRWQSSFSPTVQQNYMSHINGAAFSGAAPFTVLMAGIRARLRPVAGTKLWWVTYVMKWDPQEWILRKADRGTFVNPGGLSNPTVIAIETARGRHTLIDLDGAGNAAGGGHGAAQLKFFPYRMANFNALGL